MRENLDSAAAVAEKAGYWTYGGAGGSLLAGIAQIDWAMWAGVVVAVIGLIINIVFKLLSYRLDKQSRLLDEQEKLLRIKKLKDECRDER